MSADPPTAAAGRGTVPAPAPSGPGPEPGRWDGGLAAAPSPHLLQSWGWGEVQATAGWRVRRLWIDHPDRPLPVTVLVTRSGAGRVPGLRRLYVPRGPALAPSDAAGYRRVEAALRRLARSVGAARIDVEVPWEAELVPASHPWLAGAPVPSRQPAVTSVVDLTGTEADRLGRCHPKTRYNIRLAERRGVTVTEARPLRELSACLGATARRQRIHLPGPSHLAAVARALGPGARPLFAVVEGEVVAAILVAVFAGEAVYLYGGATGRHRDRMPNHLLHWRAMELAVRLGCDRYDLWGMPPSDDPRHPWHGLRQFKLGFGGRTLTLAGDRSVELSPMRAGILRALEAGGRRIRRR